MQKHTESVRHAVLTLESAWVVLRMARKPRVHFAGALYHVMCRGNQGHDPAALSRGLGKLADELGKNRELQRVTENIRHTVRSGKRAKRSIRSA